MGEKKKKARRARARLSDACGETFSKRLPLFFLLEPLSPSMPRRGLGGGCATCASGGTPSLCSGSLTARAERRGGKQESRDCFAKKKWRESNEVYNEITLSSSFSHHPLFSLFSFRRWAFVLRSRPGRAARRCCCDGPCLSAARWWTQQPSLQLQLRRREQQQQRHRRRCLSLADSTPAAATAPSSTPASAPTRWQGSARPAARGSRPRGGRGWSSSRSRSRKEEGVMPPPVSRLGRRGEGPAAPPPPLPMPRQRQVPLVPSGPGS